MKQDIILEAREAAEEAGLIHRHENRVGLERLRRSATGPRGRTGRDCSMTATFDKNDHALKAGWATYHKRLGWRRILCLFGHSLPDAPSVQDGHSPSNLGRCRRCSSFVKWYVVGQHRYGGLNA